MSNEFDWDRAMQAFKATVITLILITVWFLSLNMITVPHQYTDVRSDESAIFAMGIFLLFLDLITVIMVVAGYHVDEALEGGRKRYDCEICGKSFGTARGCHIHETQQHASHKKHKEDTHS